MPREFRRPFETIDYRALMQAHSPPPEYFEGDYTLGPEQIEERQLAALQKRAKSAYQVPFFRKRWDAAGFDPSKLRSLDDLARVPAYKVDDIRASVEAVA